MTEEVHGGNIYRAARKYGQRAQGFLDFSANINPLGMPEGMREILLMALDGIGSYPDPECTGLREGIAGYLGVATENIIIGNGASEVIFLLMQTLRPSRLLIPAPAFLEYEKAAAGLGIPVDFFQIREEENFVLDIDGLITTMNTGYDTLLLCNPNNPTSRLLDRGELVRLLEAAAVNRTTVIVDEAFIELTAGGNANSAADLLGAFENLFIIRAFTKVFAIPGLRLGYGLGAPGLIKAMWNRKMPWSVNTLACSIGELLPFCGDFLRRTQAWLREEKEWFFRELTKVDGIKAYAPDTNFILVRLTKEAWTAQRLKETMAVDGILIRNAGNFHFLDERYIRLAVKDRESNLRCLQAIKRVMLA